MELQTKCQCGEKLMSDVKVEDGILIIEVESCAKCIANAIAYSEDQPWLRNKFLKEGGYTDYEINSHKAGCKCRDCQDQRGDEEYQRRKDDALCETNER